MTMTIAKLRQAIEESPHSSACAAHDTNWCSAPSMWADGSPVCPRGSALTALDELELEQRAALKLIEGYRNYMEDNGYGLLKCDCDPSVGIDTCDYCEVGAYLEVNSPATAPGEDVGNQ